MHLASGVLKIQSPRESTGLTDHYPMVSAGRDITAPSMVLMIRERKASKGNQVDATEGNRYGCPVAPNLMMFSPCSLCTQKAENIRLFRYCPTRDRG